MRFVLAAALLGGDGSFQDATPDGDTSHRSS
jgi:hypothetical protein